MVYLATMLKLFFTELNSINHQKLQMYITKLRNYFRRKLYCIVIFSLLQAITVGMRSTDYAALFISRN